MEYCKHVFMLRNDAEADILYTFFEKLRGVTKRKGDTLEIPQNVIRAVPYGELCSVFYAYPVNYTGLISITRELRFKKVYISRHSKWNAVAIEMKVESYESQEVCGEQQTVAHVGGDKEDCRKAQPTFAPVGGAKEVYGEQQQTVAHVGGAKEARVGQHPTLAQIYGDKEDCVDRHPTLVQIYGGKEGCRKAQPTFAQVGSAKEVYGEQQQTVARVGGAKVARRKAQPAFAQVGGDHYSKMKVQPIDFITANGLGYIEGNIIKYVCRYKSKNGVEDLKKAQHYLQMLIEQGERDEGPRQAYSL